MKCIECKWFVCASNDQYGLCKRYPIAQNKTQQDWCGEFNSKVAAEEPIKKLKIKFEEPTEIEAQREGTFNIETGEFKPLKRVRKVKQ